MNGLLIYKTKSIDTIKQHRLHAKRLQNFL